MRSLKIVLTRRNYKQNYDERLVIGSVNRKRGMTVGYLKQR